MKIMDLPLDKSTDEFSSKTEIIQHNKRKSHGMQTRGDLSNCSDITEDNENKNLKRVSTSMLDDHNIPEKKNKSKSNDSSIIIKDKKIKHTIPTPFSFLHREQLLLQKKAALSKQAELEAVKMANSFRAGPIRSFGTPDRLPKRRPSFVCKQVPFDLATSHRVEKHNKSKSITSNLDDTVSSNSSNSLNTSVAKLLRFRRAEPFVPVPSSLPLTEPKSPVLTTESRAVERACFDADVVAIRALEEEQRKKLQEATAREEEKENRLRRLATVHKPEPITKYRLVGPSMSATGSPLRKLPTRPISPNFSARLQFADKRK